MNELSDKYLRSIFQSRLKEREVEPNPLSWEKLQTQLPAQTPLSASKHGKPRYSHFVFAISLVILTGLTIVGIIGDTVEEPTQQPVLNETDLPSDTDFDTNKFDKQVKVERSTTLQHKEHIDLTIQKIERSPNPPDPIQGLDIYEENTYDAETSDHTLIQMPAGDQKFLMEHDRSGFKIRSLNLLPPLPVDDTLCFRESISDTTTSPVQMRDKRALRENSTRLFRLIVKPFYNTAVFSPVAADNIYMKNFSQSKNLLDNRLGFAISLAQVWQVSSGLTLEYAVGYQLFHKHFEYAYDLYMPEAIEASTRDVDGSVQSYFVSLRVKKMILSQPIDISVRFDNMTNGALTPYLGPYLFYVGVGYERKITRKFALRPCIQYGLPLAKRSEHFKINPVNWELELIMDLPRGSKTR